MTIFQDQPDDVRCLFVDDCAILARSLADHVSQIPDCTCRGWSGPLADLPADARARDTDIVIIDPDQWASSPEGLRDEIVDLFDAVEVVAFLPEKSGDAARSCLQASYSGVISRGSTLTSFLHAVESVVAGGVYVDGAFGSLDQSSALFQDDPVGGGELTNREFEILCQVAQGRAAKEIARILAISPKTVETHKYRGMSKLGLADRGAVHDFAIAHAWF